MRNPILILAFTFFAAAFIYFDFSSFFASAPEKPSFTQRAEVRSGEQVCAFTVAFADTPRQRAQGLMNTTSLPENQGMLFDFGQNSIGAMWMKDTPLSLDIIFIDYKGVVQHIAPNAVPNSTTPITTPGPVRAALEVIAGTVARCGIVKGSTVTHTMFGKH